MPPAVAQKFANYPDHVRPKLLRLRRLVLEVAQTLDAAPLEESLKWGEPSYRAPQGTPIRMDWKARSPDEYALYFTCTTRMIPVIQTVFGDTFRYEGTRALLFDLDAPLPEAPLRACLGAALRYKRVRGLPLLGI